MRTPKQDSRRLGCRVILLFVLVACVAFGVYFRFLKPQPHKSIIVTTPDNNVMATGPLRVIKDDATVDKPQDEIISKSDSSTTIDNNNNEVPTPTTDASTETLSPTKIIYKKIQEGRLEGGNQEPYIVYGAYYYSEDKKPVTVLDWAKLLKSQDASADDLAMQISKVITDVPYKGVFLETPGVFDENAEKAQFQFCLVDGGQLAEAVEPIASSRIFQGKILTLFCCWKNREVLFFSLSHQKYCLASFLYKRTLSIL